MESSQGRPDIGIIYIKPDAVPKDIIPTWTSQMNFEYKETRQRTSKDIADSWPFYGFSCGTSDLIDCKDRVTINVIP